jgi:hypothetical protein
VPDFDYCIFGGDYEACGMKPTDPVLPKDGYGGHPVGARPKRRALTVYQGRQPFTLEVPMYLWRDGESVEEDRIALDNMATSEGELQGQAPPVVQIKASYPLPIPPALGTQDTAFWWIEDIVWGEEFRKPPHEGGFITYKVVTVNLLEWTPDTLLEKGTATRIGKYHVKKPPDTLKSIAATYGISVSTLKKLNPKLRSDDSLKDKMTISVPAHVKEAPGPKGKRKKK